MNADQIEAAIWRAVTRAVAVSVAAGRPSAAAMSAAVSDVLRAVTPEPGSIRAEAERMRVAAAELNGDSAPVTAFRRRLAARR